MPAAVEPDRGVVAARARRPRAARACARHCSRSPVWPYAPSSSTHTGGAMPSARRSADVRRRCRRGRRGAEQVRLGVRDRIAPSGTPRGRASRSARRSRAAPRRGRDRLRGGQRVDGRARCCRRGSRASRRAAPSRRRRREPGASTSAIVEQACRRSRTARRPRRGARARARAARATSKHVPAPTPIAPAMPSHAMSSLRAVAGRAPTSTRGGELHDAVRGASAARWRTKNQPQYPPAIDDRDQRELVVHGYDGVSTNAPILRNFW